MAGIPKKKWPRRPDLKSKDFRSFAKDKRGELQDKFAEEFPNVPLEDQRWIYNLNRTKLQSAAKSILLDKYHPGNKCRKCGRIQEYVTRWRYKDIGRLKNTYGVTELTVKRRTQLIRQGVEVSDINIVLFWWQARKWEIVCDRCARGDLPIIVREALINVGLKRTPVYRYVGPRIPSHKIADVQKAMGWGYHRVYTMFRDLPSHAVVYEIAFARLRLNLPDLAADCKRMEDRYIFNGYLFNTFMLKLGLASSTMLRCLNLSQKHMFPCITGRGWRGWDRLQDVDKREDLYSKSTDC